MLNLKNKADQTFLWGMPTLLAALVLAAACLSPTPTSVPALTPTATPVPSPSPTPTTAPTFTPTATATAIPSPSPTPTSKPNGAYTQAVINGHTLRLEVADDPAERTKGLMGRPSLPEEDAMLFVFLQEAVHAFWMKNTLIPLDILFVDKELKIASVQTMQPEPGVSDDQLLRYEPPVPVIYAIEMNAGLAQKYGFALGMRVEFK